MDTSFPSWQHSVSFPTSMVPRRYVPRDCGTAAFFQRVSPFGQFWFVSFLPNKTLMISIAPTEFWVTVADYWASVSSGNPQIWGQRVRNALGLGTPQLATGARSEGRLVNDCPLNLWSLAPFQVIGSKSLQMHCTIFTNFCKPISFFKKMVKNVWLFCNFRKRNNNLKTMSGGLPRYLYEHVIWTTEICLISEQSDWWDYFSPEVNFFELKEPVLSQLDFISLKMSKAQHWVLNLCH